eukprot:1159741-Pelagomonas_calceolata.AAC.12
MSLMRSCASIPIILLMRTLLMNFVRSCASSVPVALHGLARFSGAVHTHALHQQTKFASMRSHSTDPNCSCSIRAGTHMG